MPDFSRDGPRVPPRFVPTLTEVVTPPQAALAAPGRNISDQQLEQIVATAIQRAELALTQRLPEVVAVLLHEHALALTDRLQKEIRTVVQQAVQAALAEQLGLADRAPAAGAADSAPP